MIKKLPKQLPGMAAMIEDIGQRPETIAKALGVSVSTVYRWKAENEAPRTAQLALFWLTSWGLSTLDAELVNTANLYRGLAACLQEESEALREQIAGMGKIGDYGCANDPGPHIMRRFSLDCAEPVRGLEMVDLAAISQDTPKQQVYQAKR